MKKLLITSSLILSFITISFGQDKVTTYSSSYFSTQYDVLASEPDSIGNFDFFINCQPLDQLTDKSVLIIEGKNSLAEFNTYIQHLKSTYIKWKQIAIENKVSKLDKIVEYENITHKGAFFTTDWYFDYSVNLTARFKIISGKYYMIIQSDELSSMLNEYINNDGFLLVFSSVEDFNSFANSLQVSKVESHYKTKSRKEELFK